ncbi:baseplate J/gp47 family protein [Campylobacter lanienae]|uniref:baseplate J/gp47 family protein n=1 Tax=Campylobacter lanienae TaxID=75658 RepID=UPI000BB42D6C|nr:baseplate J/gp47 family protein [Campylobacter lanienae]
MNIENLPYPPIIEELSYEEILNSIKSLFKANLNDSIELLESDEYSALLECLAYREMLLRARINAAIKGCLLPYANEGDLDNVVAFYGIERLRGEYPKASVEFSLSMVRSVDIIIPSGAVLTDSNNSIAILARSVVLKAGELSASGEIILQEHIQTSNKKCEYIQTPLPYVLKAKQTTTFSGGADPESDEALRARAILSLDRFSTAGASGAYKFHALSSSAKVKDCAALNGGAGIVNIYIQSSDESDIALEVLNYLSSDNRRPLTDKVVVFMANKKSVLIKATLELNDMLNQSNINNQIQGGVLALGQDLNLSFLYSNLHTSGVYRAIITDILVDGEPVSIADVIADATEYISYEYEISFKEAVL